MNPKKCVLSYFFLRENLLKLPLIFPFMIQVETKTFLCYEEQQYKTMINGNSHPVSFLGILRVMETMVKVPSHMFWLETTAVTWLLLIIAVR